MSRKVMMVALAAMLAWATAALAQDAEKKKKKAGGKGGTVTGTLTGATVTDDTVTWKVTGEDGAAQELPMANNVVAMYSDKNGVNHAMMIRVAGKKVPEAKGNRQVASGTIPKEGGVTIAGDQATIKIGDTSVVLPTAVKVMVRDKDGAKQAIMIGPAGKPKGDKPPKGEGKKTGGRKKKGGDAPPNL